MSLPPRSPALALSPRPPAARVTTLATELGTLLQRLGIEAVVTTRAGETLCVTEHASSLLESTDLRSRRVVEVRIGGEALCVAVPAQETRGVALDLTPRQRAVVELIADGFSNLEIAERLGISLHTVRRHVEGMLRRLQVPSRAAAAVLLQQSRAAERSNGRRRVEHAKDSGNGRDGHRGVLRVV